MLKIFFFITSYQEKMANEYIIYINKRDQKNYFFIEEEIEGKKYCIYINKIEKSLKEKTNGIFEIPIEIEEKSNGKKEKRNEYNLKI